MAASAVANAVCQDRTSGREVSGAAAGRSARVAQERRTACAAGVRGGRCRSGPARMPTARPRLWAITVKAAALAENWLEGTWANPADFSSAMACSTTACRRWSTSTSAAAKHLHDRRVQVQGQRGAQVGRTAPIVQSRASSSRLTTSCCRTWPRTRSWTATRSGAPADRVQRETGNGPRRRRAPR